MSLRIGLTGGIGSGKTTISGIFTVLGIPVFDADSAAKELMQTSAELKAAIIEKFGGGPVGLGTISASIHEEKDSIEEIIEPYLIQVGFLDRTPRGRMATPLAYQHFNLKPPSPHKLGLFDPR